MVYTVLCVHTLLWSTCQDNAPLLQDLVGKREHSGIGQYRECNGECYTYLIVGKSYDGENS